MKRILVVEDEPLLRAAMKHALDELPDTRVSATGEVAEARGLIACDHPDLVVADLRLPDGSGVELLGALDALGLRSPILFLSAYLDEFSTSLPQSRAYEVRAKPISMDTLQKLARTYLAQPLRPPLTLSDFVRIASVGRDSLQLRLKRGREELGRVVMVDGQIWSVKTASGQRGPNGLSELIECSGYRTLLDPLDAPPTDASQFNGDTDSALLAASGVMPLPANPLAPTAPPLADPFSSHSAPPMSGNTIPPLVAMPLSTAPTGTAPPVAVPPATQKAIAPMEEPSAAPMVNAVASATRPMVSGPVIVAAIVSLAAVVVALILKPGDEFSTRPRRAVSVARGIGSEDLKTLLDRGSALIQAGRHKDATALLAGVGSGHQGSAQQRIRLVELLSDASVGRSLALAIQSLDTGDTATAMKQLQTVLMQRPSEAKALTLLKRIRAKNANAQVANTARRVVRLVAKPPGLFFVDGAPVGFSPVEAHPFTLGAHRIEVRREGYQSHAQTFNVTGTTPTQFDITLTPSP